MEIRLEFRRGGLDAVAAIGAGPVDLDDAVRHVLQELTRQGAKELPQPASVQQTLASALGKPPMGPAEVAVAQGTAPTPGVGAQLTPTFAVCETPPIAEGDVFAIYAANVAYPDDIILRKTPASPGVAGRSLTGGVLAAPSGSDIAVSLGGGVAEEEGGLCFRAKTYGVVLFHAGKLKVVDAVKVSDDLMEVNLTVLPDLGREESHHVEAVLHALDRLGIKRGVDVDAIQKAVREARAGHMPVHGVVAARGQLPIDGREPDHRLVFDLERKAGTPLDGNRIDFRETGSVKNARKGDVLAEIVAGQDPAPGFRVDGSILNPQIFRAQGLKPGDHTETSEDGTRVVAATDGVVVVKGGKFHIDDECVVAGDVDFSTGNIHTSGTVRVRGQVKPGFLVEAGKEAEIAGDVWEARIEAKGAVKVKGAITSGSQVKAGGNVSARFILNSRVETEGDLDVALSVTGSEIYAKGKLRVVGSQGVILGGEINAARGVEARTIGSPGSRTRVVVGVDLRVTRELEEIGKIRPEIAETFRALYANLGKEFLKDPKAALVALPPTLRKPKLEILQKIRDLQERDRTLEARQQELLTLAAEEKDACISVLGEIHAGTLVAVGSAKTTLTDTLFHVMLHYDAKNNCITWRKL